MGNIIIGKYYTPENARGFNWVASIGGDLSEGHYGFGATELEAFNDLMKQLDIARKQGE